MSIIKALSLILIPAFFGGLVSAWTSTGHHDRIGKWPPKGKQGRNIKLAHIVRIMSGMIAALGVMAIALWAGKLSFKDISLEYEFVIIGISAVAGSMGYRLLPHLQSSLLKKIEETDSKVDETKEAQQKDKEILEGKVQQTKETQQKEADAIRSKVKQTTVMQQKSKENLESRLGDTQALLEKSERYSKAIAAAQLAFDSNSGLGLQKAIKLTEEAKKDRPSDRSLNINLGRLYRKRADLTPLEYDSLLNEAIELLGSYIENAVDDNDKAAAYFNRACYFNLMGDHKSAPESTQLKEEALNNLAEALRLNPEYKKNATKDKDLKSLRNGRRFKELTKS